MRTIADWKPAMASKELIEKVAEAIAKTPPNVTGIKDMETLEFSRTFDYTPTAEAAILTILAALQEPTEGMCKTSMLTTKEVKIYWPQLLNASPLGEQSE